MDRTYKLSLRRSRMVVPYYFIIRVIFHIMIIYKY